MATKRSGGKIAGGGSGGTKLGRGKGRRGGGGKLEGQGSGGTKIGRGGSGRRKTSKKKA